MFRKILRSYSRAGTRFPSVAVLTIAMLAGAPGAFGVKPFLSGSILEAVLETDSCTRGAPTPCGQLSSTEAATPTTTHPIRITLSVIRPNGVPVTGLLRGDFDFEWRFGTNMSIPSVGTCADCFEDPSTLVGGPPGMYVLYVTPSFGSWEDVNISRLRIDVTAVTSLHMLMKIDLR